MNNKMNKINSSNYNLDLEDINRGQLINNLLNMSIY